MVNEDFPARHGYVTAYDPVEIPFYFNLVQLFYNSKVVSFFSRYFSTSREALVSQWLASSSSVVETGNKLPSTTKLSTIYVRNMYTSTYIHGVFDFFNPSMNY